jgi:hypothetical protein
MTSRYTLLILATSIFIWSCKNERISEIEVTKPAKSSNLQRGGTPYQLQPLCLDGSTSNEMENFVADYKIDSLLKDANCKWDCFNNIYNTNFNQLDITSKQLLSYYILSSKDLIGLLQQNPQNTTYKTAVEKHIEALIQSKYSGYTVLYYALLALQNAGYSNASSLANDIYQYGRVDSTSLWSYNAITTGTPTLSTEDHELHSKLAENYKHLFKIKEAFLP